MAGKIDVLLDTSVLINFARIRRLDLLADHPRYSFFVTDHVRAEVLEHFRDEFEAVNTAVTDGILTELTVNTTAELEDFGRLVSMKTLGAGECSAIVVAKHRSLVLAIDDVTARNKALKFHTALAVLGTEELIVSLIQENILSIKQADRIKSDWEANHRFRLKFSSFRERI
jgi:predicted nucleic acid-binding protein